MTQLRAPKPAVSVASSVLLFSSHARTDVSRGQVFDAFQNGQLAARKLNWLAKASKGNYAKAAGRFKSWKGDRFTGRRDEWKNEGKQFQDFFKCFTAR